MEQIMRMDLGFRRGFVELGKMMRTKFRKSFVEPHMREVLYSLWMVGEICNNFRFDALSDVVGT